MRTARTSRGFTLIEIMAALAAVSVLILAMGSTLFWLLRGEQQSVAANDAFNRTDLIRDVLHTNLRAGRAIRFPTTDALVSYPADGVGVAGRGTISTPVAGEQVWVELQYWNGAAFEIRQTVWTWESGSQVLGNQWAVSSIGGAAPGGAYTWSQSSLTNFDVIRVSSRRIRFVVDSNTNGQLAQSQFTVTLRNIP